MKKEKILLFFAGVSIAACACSAQQENADRTVPQYTLEYQSQESTSQAEQAAGPKYYYSLAMDGTWKWGDFLAYPDFANQENFDSADYTNWAPDVVKNELTRGGYFDFFSDMRIQCGEKFYALPENQMKSDITINPGYRGRIFIMLTVGGGAFDFRVEDGEGTVLWSRNQITESDEIFLDIDEMPEAIYGFLTDRTAEEEKDSLFYSVILIGAAEREAIKEE